MSAALSVLPLQAALGAIQCYLALHDAPAAAAAAEEAAEAQLAALSPEERKREKLRRKKVGSFAGSVCLGGGCVRVKGGEEGCETGLGLGVGGADSWGAQEGESEAQEGGWLCRVCASQGEGGVSHRVWSQAGCGQGFWTRVGEWAGVA
jgi:hypothetical protein